MTGKSEHLLGTLGTCRRHQMIDLCLEVFQWAKFRKHKGGIKVHTLYDIESQVPAFFHITVAATSDIKVMPEIPYEKGRITSSTVGTTTSPISTR